MNELRKNTACIDRRDGGGPPRAGLHRYPEAGSLHGWVEHPQEAHEHHGAGRPAARPQQQGNPRLQETLQSTAHPKGK